MRRQLLDIPSGIVWALILITLVLACDREEEEPQEETPIGMEGSWYAVGEGIAPLFRVFPFETDSIYIRVKEFEEREYGEERFFRFYMEEYQKNFERKFRTTSSAPSSVEWGARLTQEDANHDGIWSFRFTGSRIRDKSSNQVDIRGIFRIDGTSEPKRMQIEFIQKNWLDSLDWPNPEQGFGTTPYRENLTHTFFGL